MDNRYITSRGVEIEFLPIPRDIQNFQRTHLQPQPPTYEVSLAGGGTENHEHTEKTLETYAEKAEWAEYQKQLGVFNEKFLNVCFARGIKVHAEIDEWIEEQKALDLAVSEEKLARKIEWLTSWVLATRADYEAVLLGVLRAAEVPEDLLKQIQGLFRGEVGKPDGTVIERPAVPENGQGVVLQPTLSGSENSVGAADTTVPV